VHFRYPQADEAIDDPPDGSNVASGLVNPLYPDDDPFSPQRFWVAWHRPAPTGDAMRFRVSIQNDDETRFSPRPAEAWVELVPEYADGRSLPSDTPPRFDFYDFNCEPDLPVPLLRFEAPQWPAGADARMQIWFKLQRSPAREFAVRDVLAAADNPRPSERLTIDRGAQGKIEFTVVFEEPAPGAAGAGGTVLRVIEAHSQGSIDYPVKVAFAPESPADEVFHEYRHSVGVVYHRFVFRTKSREEVARCLLQLTPREAMQKGAVTLGEKKLVIRPRHTASP
jgi:hypothetical protein